MFYLFTSDLCNFGVLIIFNCLLASMVVVKKMLIIEEASPRGPHVRRRWILTNSILKNTVAREPRVRVAVVYFFYFDFDKVSPANCFESRLLTRIPILN